MTNKTFFFAGGGTGGHIYPAIAIAEQIVKLEPEAKIHFFISTRSVDSKILSATNFEYTLLPAKGFSFRVGRLLKFCSSFLESYKIAGEKIAESGDAVVVGIGGFVAAPACLAAHRLKVPVKLLNIDFRVGRANRIIARWADEVFVQFPETVRYFKRRGLEINVFGCPLRSSFAGPDVEKMIKELNLDRDKKTLVITGASSGAVSINETVCSLLDRLAGFADEWQIVHLTGQKNYDEVRTRYRNVKIKAKVAGYYDDMASLLAGADLVIGRSGAGSVAEFAAAAVPSICMPYPHHSDRHQYFNAGKLVEAGAAVVVDDLPDEVDRKEWLWEELEVLLKDDEKRAEMKKACKSVAKTTAAVKIAESLCFFP